MNNRRSLGSWTQIGRPSPELRRTSPDDASHPKIFRSSDLPVKKSGCEGLLLRGSRYRHEASEVAFAFFGFHRAFFVEVDQATLALGVLGEQHLADDVGQRGGARFERTRQWVTAQRAETHHLEARLFSGIERESVIVDHQQGAVALDHRALCRKI